MDHLVANRPIGIFDSGVGGISVLREMVGLMPLEKYIYYGDNKNAPYGTKDELTILRLVRDAVEALYQRDIKALVIACNTATSAAVNDLREEAKIPIVGMEPALKTAAFNVNKGVILVMATPATLKLEKFDRLMSLYGQNAVPVPCMGLMEFVERGDRDSTALMDYLNKRFAPHRGKKIGGVVLGCTHYVFIKDAIEKALPGVPQFDGNLGTARRLQALLQEQGALKTEGEGCVELLSSGGEPAYQSMMSTLLYE